MGGGVGQASYVSLLPADGTSVSTDHRRAPPSLLKSRATVGTAGNMIRMIRYFFSYFCLLTFKPKTGLTLRS